MPSRNKILQCTTIDAPTGKKNRMTYWNKIVVLAFVLVMPFHSVFAQSSEVQNQHVDEGIRLYKKARFYEAIGKFQIALKGDLSDSDKAAAYLHWGYCIIADKNNSEEARKEARGLFTLAFYTDIDAQCSNNAILSKICEEVKEEVRARWQREGFVELYTVPATVPGVGLTYMAEGKEKTLVPRQELHPLPPDKYKVTSVDIPDWYTCESRPRSFTINPGEKTRVEIKLTPEGKIQAPDTLSLTVLRNGTRETLKVSKQPELISLGNYEIEEVTSPHKWLRPVKPFPSFKVQHEKLVNLDIKLDAIGVLQTYVLPADINEISMRLRDSAGRSQTLTFGRGGNRSKELKAGDYKVEEVIATTPGWLAKDFPKRLSIARGPKPLKIDIKFVRPPAGNVIIKTDPPDIGEVVAYTSSGHKLSSTKETNELASGQYELSHFEAPLSTKVIDYTRSFEVRSSETTTISITLRGNEWPMLGGNRQHTRSYSDKVRNINNFFALHKQDGPIFCAPTVAEEKVFIGGNDGVLRAINADSGEQMWAHTTGGPIFSSPLVHNKKVFFGSDDGNFYILDAQNGQVLKQHQIGEAIKSSPAQRGDLVCFTAGNKIYFINSNTGDTLAEPYSVSNTSERLLSPIICEDRIAVCGQKIVYVLSFKGEKPVEKMVLLNGLIIGDPSAHADMLFVPVYENNICLYAINLRRAKVSWKFADVDALSMAASAPATTGNTVFFATDRNLYALDLKGEIQWSRNYSNELRDISACPPAPVVDSDKIYLIGGEGKTPLYIIDIEDQSSSPDLVYGINSNPLIKGGFITEPVIAYGNIFVASNNGSLYKSEIR